MTALSDVRICNRALLEIGLTKIVSLNDTDAKSQACNALFEIYRDELLESHPWRFAIERAELAQLSSTPAFEYDYEYQLPSNFLRPIELYDSTYDFVIEGGKLLTNQDDEDNGPYLVYVKRVTDPTLFSLNFAKALSKQLSATLAMSLAQNKTLSEQKMTEHIDAMHDAMMHGEIFYRLEAKEQNEAEGNNVTWQSAGR